MRFWTDIGDLNFVHLFMGFPPNMIEGSIINTICHHGMQEPRGDHIVMDYHDLYNIIIILTLCLKPEK